LEACPYLTTLISPPPRSPELTPCGLDDAYYALTDATGAFKLPDLPAGTYTIEAAHPREGRLKRQITVGDAGATADFTLPGRPKADSTKTEVFAPGLFNFVNVPVPPVLDIYEQMAARELTIAPEVQAANERITLKTDQPITRGEAIKLLERALA